MAVRLERLDEVLAAIEKLSDTSKLEGALQDACALVERSAKQKAPKDSGALRRSITSEVKCNGSSIEGKVFTPLEYAPYIEYGTGLFSTKGGRKDVPWSYQDDNGEWHTTSGIHPHPFMKPALHDNRNKIVKTIKEGLTNG